MSPFIREDRYIVIKRTDARNLFPAEKDELEGILQHLQKIRQDRDKRDNPDCDGLMAVVVEHDWPEYQLVWEMLQIRAAEEQGSPYTDGHAMQLVKNLVSHALEWLEGVTGRAVNMLDVRTRDMTTIGDAETQVLPYVDIHLARRPGRYIR